jgi:hypothetical protein
MSEQPIGYMVAYSENQEFDGYVWPMQIDTDPKAPFNALCSIGMGGVKAPALFNSRKEARAAINATHYFAKAHYPNHEDERKSLYILPVYACSKDGGNR